MIYEAIILGMWIFSAATWGKAQTDAQALFCWLLFIVTVLASIFLRYPEIVIVQEVCQPAGFVY